MVATIMRASLHPCAGIQDTGTATIRRIRVLQGLAGATPCFATDLRFSCKGGNCPWRAECLRPIAAWMS